MMKGRYFLYSRNLLLPFREVSKSVLPVNMSLDRLGTEEKEDA